MPEGYVVCPIYYVECNMPKNTQMSYCVQSRFAVFKLAHFSAVLCTAMEYFHIRLCELNIYFKQTKGDCGKTKQVE